MFFQDAFMSPAEIEPDHYADAILMAFPDHIAEHIILQVGIGILVFQLCGIEGHDPACIDQECIGGKKLQVGKQGIRIEGGFVGRQIGLDQPEVIGFPPEEGIRPGGDRSRFL
jgi:hypothetical protein